MNNYELYPHFFGFHIQKYENSYRVITQNGLLDKPRTFYVSYEGLKLMKKRIEAVIEMEKEEKEGGAR